MAEILGIGRTAVYNHLGLGRIKNPDWTDEEVQVLVDGYAEGLTAQEIAKKLPGRTPLAVRIRMHRHRKEIRKNPKKQRALRAITWALKAVRKADIFREMES